MIPYSRYQSGYQGNWFAQVDQEGRLIFPAEAATCLGLQAGVEVELETDTNGLKLHRPFTHLAKVYVEPTNRCNLHCRTCMRNSWNITPGMMSEETLCTQCSGCDYIESNEADCFGSPFPTCGGCLWAQGVIQCP